MQVEPLLSRGWWAEACTQEFKGFAGGVDGAFELGVFGVFEHGFELGAGGVAGGDEVASGDEEGWADVLGGSGFVLLFGEVVEAEVTVAGGAVEPVEGEVLVEAGQAEEALEGGLLHLEDVSEAHVIVDEGDDLGGVVVGEAKAIQHNLGDADADLDVAVEADAVVFFMGIRRAEGGRLPDVVQERAPGEGGGAVEGELLEQEHGVGPDIALGVELGRLGDAVHLDGFGEDLGEEAGDVEKLEGAAGVALSEHLGDLVADALVADLVDGGGLGLDRGHGAWFDLEL